MTLVAPWRRFHDEAASLMAQICFSIEENGVKLQEMAEWPLILKSFGKHFHSTTSNASFPIEKLSNLLPQEPFKQQILQKHAHRVFELMQQVHQWQQRAFDALVHFFLEPTHLEVEAHRQLTQLVLHTFVLYVKMHLLWTSYSELPAILSLHAFFHSANDEIAFPDKRLREYVILCGANPLPKLQQDVSRHPQIATNLLKLITSCLPSCMNAQDLAHVRNQGAFDVEAAFSGQYANLPVYQELLAASDQQEWIVCAALCLPSRLRSTANLWELVTMVLRHQLMLCVFRDRCVNVHQLLHQCPTDVAAKELTKVTKHALYHGLRAHEERQAFALWASKHCSQQLEHRPALVGPLFPMLLCVLAITKRELEWALYHANERIVPSFIKPKHWQRLQPSYESVLSTSISALAAALHRLRQLVEAHPFTVVTYYAKFVAAHHIPALQYHAAKIQLTDQFTEALEQLIGQLDQSSTHSNEVLDQVERLSFQLLQQSVENPLMQQFTGLWWHLQYIGRPSDLLEEFASVSKCWWCADALIHATKCLTSHNLSASSLHNLMLLMESLAALRNGAYQLHELQVAEEMDRQVFRIHAISTELMQIVANGVVSVLETITQQESDAQVKAMELVDGMMALKTSKASEVAGLRKKSSRSMLRRTLKSVSLSDLNDEDADGQKHRTATSVLYAAASILRQSALSEKLRDAMATSLQHMVTRVLQEALEKRPSGFVLMVSFDALKNKLDRLLHTVTRVFGDEYLVTKMQEAMQVQCSFSSKEQTFIDCLFQFFARFPQTQCSPYVPHGYVASTRIQGFFAMASNPKDMDPSDYTTSEALAALRDILGPDQLMALSDRLLSELVLTQANAMKTSLELDKIALIRFHQSLEVDDPVQLIASLKMLKHQDQLIAQAIQMGNTLWVLRAMRSSRLFITEADQKHFQKLQLDAEARAIWNLLVSGISASFFNRIWRTTVYIPEENATSTNVHVMMTSLSFLTKVLATTELTPEDDEEEREMHRTILKVCGTAALRTRSLASDLPSLAMLQSLRLLQKHLSGHQNNDGELERYCPQALVELVHATMSKG